MNRLGSLGLLLLFGFVACAPDDGGVSEAQLQQQNAAARDACIAERLHLRAQDELETLVQLQVGPAPLGFQQAYTQHAELRLTSLALLDSAYNHARSPQDSTRYANASMGYEIRLPEAGSVEDNVLRSYETNFLQILEDEDHPCNWQAELQRG